MKISWLLTISMVALFLVTPPVSGSDDEVNAGGTFTVNGETVNIRYAYVDESDDDVMVLLSDNPVERKDVPFGAVALAEKGEIHALVVTISRKTKQIERAYNVLLHKTWQGQLGTLGETVKLTVTTFDDKILEGRIVVDPPEKFMDYTFSYDVTFKVKLGIIVIIPPIKAVVTGDDSPEGKVYAAYYKAFMAGDMEALKKVVVAERIPSLDDPGVKEFIDMDRQSRPQTIKIVKAESSGDAGTVTIEGTSDEGQVSATISMVKQNGVWKVGRESFQVGSN